MRTRSPSRVKDAKDDTEIYVGNINAQTPVEPEDLKRLFGIAGTVSNVRIEKSNSKDTHFAFITFGSVEEAEQGCLYDGFKYHALSLKVQRKGRPGPPKFATPPSEDFTRKLKELQEQENTDLYLTNLNTADASEEVLHDTFSAFGDVRRVHLHGDPSNPSRPAFITFSRPEQVQRAVDAMDGKEFLGNTLGVCKARVGQRFWAIEAATKSKSFEDRDSEKKDSKSDKNGKRTGTSTSSSGSKDEKDKDKDSGRKRRGRENASINSTKEKEDGKKEPVKDDKASTGRTPPTKSIPASTTKPANHSSTATSAAAVKPASKTPASQPPTTIKTAAKLPAGQLQPPQLSAPPEDAADPAQVIESILAGLERTRTADKEKNIGLYCSTDNYGIPTMVLPSAGERVCNALHTVAQSIRRELEKLKEHHAAATAPFKSELEQAQQRLALANQECGDVKEAFYSQQEAYNDLVRHRDQFATLRLVNVKPESTAKDIAQMCSQYGPVQHVSMLGLVAHVTFCTPVNYQEIAAQLSSQIGGHQAEACFHSATVAADVAKQSQAPNALGNGPTPEHAMHPGMDPLMAPSFPQLPLMQQQQPQQQQQQQPPLQQSSQQPQPQVQQQQAPSQAATSQQQRPVPQEGVCIVCSKVGLQVCSVCMKTYYCGSECQARDWPDHMNECEQLKAKRR
eukprot:TRINITY_DN1757_c0_g1_i2.p1 TRINITY_DN1757_c0_g1~~TRINITY_DN1757_c0_g1_i2.p1  ORF type:complete len:680 (+),score=181.57 TRINITY_DN1757_c0_g1_i2:212-2251(+)